MITTYYKERAACLKEPLEDKDYFQTAFDALKTTEYTKFSAFPKVRKTVAFVAPKDAYKFCVCFYNLGFKINKIKACGTELFCLSKDHCSFWKTIVESACLYLDEDLASIEDTEPIYISTNYIYKENYQNQYYFINDDWQRELALKKPTAMPEIFKEHYEKADHAPEVFEPRNGFRYFKCPTKYQAFVAMYNLGFYCSQLKVGNETIYAIHCSEHEGSNKMLDNFFAFSGYEEVKLPSDVAQSTSAIEPHAKVISYSIISPFFIKWVNHPSRYVFGDV